MTFHLWSIGHANRGDAGALVWRLLAFNDLRVSELYEAVSYTHLDVYKRQAQGKAFAHATGTFKFVRGVATGAKTANSLQGIATD